MCQLDLLRRLDFPVWSLINTADAASNTRCRIEFISSPGDHDVQYHAMMGLGALVGYSDDAPYAPALGLFDQDPAKYLGNWKSWWETSGKQKFESGR